MTTTLAISQTAGAEGLPERLPAVTRHALDEEITERRRLAVGLKIKRRRGTDSLLALAMRPPAPGKIFYVTGRTCEDEANRSGVRLYSSAMRQTSQPAAVLIQLERLTFPANAMTTRALVPFGKPYGRSCRRGIDPPRQRNLFSNRRKSEVIHTQLRLETCL
jgi:hypothetical protein